MAGESDDGFSALFVAPPSSSHRCHHHQKMMAAGCTELAVPSGGFCLMALPLDLLLTVLQQPNLGPCELCRLEACSSSLHALIRMNS